MNHISGHLISIVLPCYNGEIHLADSIQSCLNQSYKNLELIIVNDCSTDETQNIANQFAENDGRIVIVNNETNKKLPASLNIGHLAAKGTYITWTSDDNILKPNFIERLLQTIELKKTDVVYSNYDIIQSDGSLKRKHQAGPTEHILFGNKIGASFLYKKEVFKELNGFNESLFLLEDYDFWLRASFKFKFYHLEENLYLYRLHENSLTSAIEDNLTTKEKHKKGIKKMINKVSSELSWNDATRILIIKHLLSKKIDIRDYLSNRKIIKNDLLKFNPIEFDKTKVIYGLRLIIRNQLLTDRHNQNLKSLFFVLKNERALLFHKSYSKKVTLKYIKNCIS